MALRRALFANRMVVFYCDLSKQTLSAVPFPSSLKVDRLGRDEELSQQDLEAIVAHWNPQLALQNIRERFAKGALLWLVRCEEQLAGYCWTIRGRAIVPYYFPMATDDVQFFDFYVFPEFRGRAILCFLISYMLHTLEAESGGRAFGDVAEWNQASLSFYKMTPFRRFGVARSFNVLGRRFTSWAKDENTEQVPRTNECRDKAIAMAGSHER
jgi:hypothetical protein